MVTEIIEVDGPRGEGRAKDLTAVLLEIAEYQAAKNNTSEQPD